MTKTEIKKLIRQGVILGDHGNKDLRHILLRHGKFFPG